MKNYKDCKVVDLGYSDMATLIMVGGSDKGLKLKPLYFGSDGRYPVYIVEEEDVEIGSHYKKVETFKYWLKIYDDEENTFRINGTEINVYRAGDFGCIIQIIK